MSGFGPHTQARNCGPAGGRGAASFASFTAARKIARKIKVAPRYRAWQQGFRPAEFVHVFFSFRRLAAWRLYSPLSILWHFLALPLECNAALLLTSVT
ncbi:hypothetical protein [Ensifer sp. ENS09]|uniref:hypothetical protein n=1 Tax=Ensifer sp. ENS09 TaxID=2769263 RepID=UPI00177D50D1|nr:hypothetical protein [Ensifer sp. ENS09]